MSSLTRSLQTSPEFLSLGDEFLLSAFRTFSEVNLQ